MAPTAAQIAELRRMIAVPAGDLVYTDAILTAYITRYPLLDERGQQPYTWDTSTTPPTQEVNTTWIETYDLNAAAADVWDEKAAAVAQLYDFSADGGNYSRSKVFDQYTARARHYRSRRAAKTMTAIKWPQETNGDTMPWIANLAEPDDP